MAHINYNTKYVIPLSVEGIQSFINLLEEEKNRLPEIAKNIVERTVAVGLEDNLSSAVAMPIEVTEHGASGGIMTTDPIDTYREYGTGIVGSENPHLDIKSGWIYDVNEHGEKGWWYPKEDGSFGWTKGIPAGKKFYEANERMKQAMIEITREELGG